MQWYRATREKMIRLSSKAQNKVWVRSYSSKRCFLDRLTAHALLDKSLKKMGGLGAEGLVGMGGTGSATREEHKRFKRGGNLTATTYMSTFGLQIVYLVLHTE